MFSRLFSGHKAPHIDVKYDPDAPLRLDEARLAAWALSLGQVRPSTDPPPRRRHRGQLPDVDFSHAFPAPRRPGLIVRLFRLASRRGGSGVADTSGGMSGSGDVAIGEAQREHYVAMISRESALAEAGGNHQQRQHAA